MSKTRMMASAGICCAGVFLSLAPTSPRVSSIADQEGGVITVIGHPDAQKETPFMCSLEKTLTKEQREHKKHLTLKMEHARIQTQEIADGYVFRFRPTDISFAEIADWVATERVCCPFFDLAIEAERENAPLALRITGRDGVKDFIRAEFHTLKLS
jgi:hypothetical protein